MREHVLKEDMFYNGFIIGGLVLMEDVFYLRPSLTD